MLNKNKPGANTNQLDIPAIPPDVEAQRCMDEAIKQDAWEYFTSMSGERYMGATRANPVPSLLELAYCAIPGTEESRKQIAQQRTRSTIHPIVL